MAYGVLQRIEGRARSLAFLWRHLAEFPHLERNLALLAERGHPDFLKFCLVRGSLDCGEVAVLEVFERFHVPVANCRFRAGNGLAHEPELSMGELGAGNCERIQRDG